MVGVPGHSALHRVECNEKGVAPRKWATFLIHLVGGETTDETVQDARCFELVNR